MNKVLEFFKTRHIAMRLYLCFAMGGLCSVAMAPLNIWPILVPGLGFLYMVLKDATPFRGLWYSWFFALGYFVIGLLWISNALLVDGNPFVWMLPIAVIGLPSLLACFFGVAGYCSVRFSDLSRLSGFFALCAFFAFCEWLRGFVLTGYPWNLFGYTWAGILPIVQIVSFSNIYVLSWLTLLWMIFPVFAYFSVDSRRQKIITGLALYSIFALSLAWGSWRLGQAGDAVLPNARVKIVQANIPQAEKWKPEKMWGHFTEQVMMSAPDPGDNADFAKATYIIWPETAMTFWMLKDVNGLAYLTDTLKAYKGPAYIMSGLLNHHEASDTFSNSFIMIDQSGRGSNLYDKHHLVPFGEYIPLQKWIPLKPVAQFTGFKLGSGPATFSTPEGLKFSPVICYEIIFSGQLTGPEKPDFIVNITNDSWYGISPGPYQHFEQAVFRAVEEGIPVIRAAGTGISGVIDPYGRVRERSSLFEKYNVTSDIPQKISTNPLKSIYSTLIFLGLLAISVLAGYRNRDLKNPS